MRSIWAGAISFGLVVIPVKLYAATEQRDITFRQVHRADGARIQFRRVCTLDGEEVPYADIAKGYELPTGDMVVLTDEDLAELPLVTAHRIEVLHFAPSAQVEPILAAKSYYLEPEPAGSRAYVLFRDALEKSGKVAVAKVALRQREALAARRSKPLSRPRSRATTSSARPALRPRSPGSSPPTWPRSCGPASPPSRISAASPTPRPSPAPNPGPPPARRPPPAPSQPSPRQTPKNPSPPRPPPAPARPPHERAEPKRAEGASGQHGMSEQLLSSGPIPHWPGKLVSLGDHQVYVRTAPAGEAAELAPPEPALCVHGLEGSSRNWTDLMALLRPRLACDALDLPGFGDSPPRPDGRYSIAALAQTVTALIERTGRGSVHLLGNSLGGAVCVKVAATRPDLIRTLTLISPALPDSHLRLDLLRFPLMSVPGVGARLLRKVQRTPAEHRVADVIASCYSDPRRFPPARLAAEVAALTRPPPPNTASRPSSPAVTATHGDPRPPGSPPKSPNSPAATRCSAGV